MEHDVPRAVVRLRRQFIMSGIGICLTSLLLTLLSDRFAYPRNHVGRPHLAFFLLMTSGFVINMIGLKAAIRLRRDPAVLKCTLLCGIGARLILLPSHPVQEVDIYRYIWDGAVLANGDSPYSYTPRDAQNVQAPSTNPQLDRLRRLRESSESLEWCLARVHYSHLTTIYPPISQIVFAGAAAVTPSDASLPMRRTIMKAFIILFDVLTLIGIIWLLRRLRMPVGWAVVYAWSPLVLKEFANSGHLDAIAVAFATNPLQPPDRDSKF